MSDPAIPALDLRLFRQHPLAHLLLAAGSDSIVQANEAAIALFGGGRKSLAGARLADLIGDAVPHPALLHERLASGRSPVSIACWAPNQARRHIEFEGASIEADAGAPLLLVTARDITARVGTESRLRDYRRIFENVPVPFYRATAGSTGRFLRVNPAFVRLFDADSAEQLCARDICSLYVDPTERKRFSDTLLQHGRVIRYELRMRTLGGRLIWATDTAFRQFDEHGNPVFDGVLEDITLQREMENDLAHQARHDTLTDLANRRYCESALQIEVARSDRHGTPLSALMMDIDHFKQINDEHGHLEGDRVLQRIAGVIRNRVRRGDVASRWGGEEFLILLPSTQASDARGLAEQLCRTIAEQHHGDDRPVTVSVGHAGYQRGEGELSFVQRLDRALYAAKEGGRNRVAAAQALID